MSSMWPQSEEVEIMDGATGALLRARMPWDRRRDQIFMFGLGAEPDTNVTDETPIIAGRHYYSIPPALGG